MAKSKSKRVERTRMSEADVEKYLKHYAKEHDLKGAEFSHAKDRCAATRWAALERNAKKARKSSKRK